ncbi:testis-expressed protein 36 [Psammomys obesus]|uniref:testis-expressed protein 36 n=1 Tax=Psammomys obesus TaxID=48139 RepID=UPI002452CF03|nr:testis-expressed protein 36 [Psammomys obesus]
MAKGRRFNPPLDKDGRWFPHIGLMQKTPESITSATLKEIHSLYLSQQAERKLPPIYKIREKQAKNNFPFSVHDNRHTFENCGCYLDSGFGRKKIPHDKRQQVSRNFNLWDCDVIPSHLDGLSNNQTSYVPKKAVVISTFRRFPKCYHEKWNNFNFFPNQNYEEFSENHPNEEFAIDTKDASPQEP